MPIGSYRMSNGECNKEKTPPAGWKAGMMLRIASTPWLASFDSQLSFGAASCRLLKRQGISGDLVEALRGL